MEVFDAALAAHRNGRLSDAERGYRALLQDDPRHSDALHLLGLIVWAKDSTTEAECLLREAIAIREDAVYLTNLANLLAESGRRQEAESMLHRALAIAPSYALAHYNLGTLLAETNRFDEAERALRDALACDAQLQEAWTNLGNLLIKCERHTEAVDAYRRALHLDPEGAAAHRDLGIALTKASRFTEAEVALQDAIQRDPHCPEAHADLAAVYVYTLRWIDAETACRRALSLDSTHLNALCNLAKVLCKTDRLEEAETVLRRNILTESNDHGANSGDTNDHACPQRRAQYAGALHLLGVVLLERGETDEAQQLFRSAISIDANAVYLTSLGDLLVENRGYDDAVDAYRAAMARSPTHAGAHRGLGVALTHKKSFAEAEAVLKEALRLEPDSADTYTTLAAVYAHTRRWNDAEMACRRALQIDGKHRTALHNLAGIMCYTDRVSDAEKLFREAIAREPYNANERFGLGQLLLSQGRYEEGWMLNEARLSPDHEAPTIPWLDLTCPKWDGESLAGKTLLLVHEQGFGDSIQFARYVPLLKALGARSVNIICEAPLKPLLQTVDGIDRVFLPNEHRPQFDFWAFFMSLPFHLGTRIDTIPDRLPYLRTLPARVDMWRTRLPKRGPKIGLVWKGSPANVRDALRSLPSLATLRPLTENTGATWISLQKGSGEAEAVDAPFAITALGPDIRDLADTAAIVAQLDLLISVDTATVHVAGALNVPCWVLLPYGSHADWRWLREPEAASPWYPNVMRLFRQRADGDWDDVMSRVGFALGEWVAAWQNRSRESP
ncbi:Flp pilus assembly protein TadD [Paraburkholderia sp. BL6665CI2N2]|uniref:tetratricopeptide repeat protein n=1 Tax=Paraburkholderia sp. BL6665CI2N2 TaxID=1938806 RepID=UPI001065E0D7|nr:tetratricopeptide repeat protein [Paraburkholderia sp. BL6665CI2N2]TDY21173.1 Flp pilus assembly protein TadD [Paraburkholderia sp. BL6665CI2N2]